MSLKEYIIYRIKEFIYRRRTCDTCFGSDGHCNECDKLTKNLYRRDYQRAHEKKQSEKALKEFFR